MLKRKRIKIRSKRDEEHRKGIRKSKRKGYKKKERRITGRLSRTEYRRGRIEEHPEILDRAQVGGRCVTQLDLSRGRMDENGFREDADNV